MDIKIQSVNFTADQKLIEHIEAKLNKLERLFDRITRIEVFLKVDAQSQQIKDKTVSIRCNVPGNQFFAEESSKSFESGADQATSALKRQIKKYKEKMRA